MVFGAVQEQELTGADNDEPPGWFCATEYFFCYQLFNTLLGQLLVLAHLIIILAGMEFEFKGIAFLHIIDGFKNPQFRRTILFCVLCQ